MNYWVMAGAAVLGLAVGFVEMKMMRQMVPMKSGARTALLMVGKLALWAGIFIGMALIGMDALIGALAGSAIYYTGAMIRQMQIIRKGE